MILLTTGDPQTGQATAKGGSGEQTDLCLQKEGLDMSSSSRVVEALGLG